MFLLTLKFLGNKLPSSAPLGAFLFFNENRELSLLSGIRFVHEMDLIFNQLVSQKIFIS